jgi:hypothetical protein
MRQLFGVLFTMLACVTLAGDVGAAVSSGLKIT